jgi:hypothetical protein
MSAEPRFTPPLAGGPSGPGHAAWFASLAGAGLSFLLFHILAPYGPASPWVAHVAGFGSVVGATLTVSCYTPAPAARRFALARPLLVLLVAAIVLGIAHRFGAMSWGPALPALIAVVVLVGLLAAGTCLGAFVGARIEEPGHVLFVALASSLADIFSVTQPEGPSAAIVRSEVALSLLALSWPMLGSDQVAPLLGVGDVVFTALYLAVARRHGLSPTRTVAWLAAAYGVTMLAVFVTQAAVPALPFLGAGMLLAHPRTWRVPARDRRRGILVLSVMAAVFIALILRR